MDEIKTNLKTWQMLKLVDENPEALVKPEPFDTFGNIKHLDLSKCLETIWSVKIPAKKVTVTRNDLYKKWSDAAKKVGCGKHVISGFKIEIESLEFDIFKEFVKELGL